VAEADRHRWNERYRERAAEPRLPPSVLLTSLDPILPRRGRALDLAGGAGRHAVWLAQRGLDVTLADVSEVALEQAREAAAAAGVTLRTLAADLEQEPLPAGPWDLIVSFHYLQRSLFAAFPDALAPDGLLVFVQPTLRNLERHSRPSAQYLLQEGELSGLVQGLEILRHEEGWSAEGRHEALLVARRPPSASS
jgi:SAM-dependent methyltransferase